MVRRPLAALATLCLAGALACSLTSLDGLSDGATPSPPGAEGGTGDATLDVAVTDAPPGKDATVDASFSCANAPVGAFCDDFESGLSKWQIETDGTGNTFVIDDTASVSGSHSALSTVGSDGSTCLTKVFSGSFQIIEVDADIRFDSKSSSTDTDYDILRLSGSDLHNLAVQVHNGVIEFDEDIAPLTDGGQDEVDTSTGHTIDAAWHHVRWTNHLSGSTADVEVLLDGTKIGGLTANALDFSGPLGFELGDCTTSPGGTPWKVHFDNVVVVTK